MNQEHTKALPYAFIYLFISFFFFIIFLDYEGEGDSLRWARICKPTEEVLVATRDGFGEKKKKKKGKEFLTYRINIIPSYQIVSMFTYLID